MCTHTVDIPLNAIVEVVLVDEGRKFFSLLFWKIESNITAKPFQNSSTGQPEPSVPSARALVQRDRYGPVAGHQRQEDQPEARAGPGSPWAAAPAVQSAPAEGYRGGAEQRLRRDAV